MRFFEMFGVHIVLNVTQKQIVVPSKEKNDLWFCHQLGSREHYSIPRALHKNGCLALLQTDAWITPKFARRLPSMGPFRSLAGRYHEDLATARVTSFTPGRLCFDVRSRLSRDHPWQAIEKRNDWFQRRCLPGLRRGLAALNKDGNQQVTVFSFSYTARELFREAKRHGARCVLGQIDPGPQEIRWVAQRCGEPPPHESPPRSYWDSWREEVDLADVIIANSEWSRGLLVQGGILPEKIGVLPLAYTPPLSANCIEPHSYPLSFSSSRPLRVLFLGQVIPRKGVSELFEAIARLKDVPVEFHIAGPIAMEIPESVKNATNVCFYGSVPRGQAESLYATSDVFILPTHSDGFAITQLESTAYRLPVIASGNCASVVIDGESGMLLTDVSSGEIERALRFCVESPETLRRWSQYSFDWSTYSIDSLGNRLRDLGEALGCG